ncbi:MAG: hypothetical protein ABFR53_10735 [Actinomycetota bacterium]
MSRQDPKPGRYILPVVIAALIGVTYVFVNALPPVDITTTSTSAPSVSTATAATPQTTTTSTLPPQIVAFLAELDRFQAVAAENLVQLNDVNTQWEAQEIEFTEAKTGFTEVRDASQTLADQVAASTVPTTYELAWPDTITAAADLVTKADAVIAGLEAPDDGTLRREAVQAFDDATSAFIAQLDVVRDQAP